LIFSNAALHWVGDHPELFPRLIAALAPGGVLAVQMPGNFAAPSHSLVRELAESSAWAGRVGEGRMGSILDMADYHRLLAPRVSRLALWETRYWQALRGASAVREWLQGTTLRPYLTPLTEAEQAEFLDTLDDLLLTAYPVDGEGVTLFPFRRVFMVAVR
jgi:trans-aconitate 2-methyltransferase